MTQKKNFERKFFEVQWRFYVFDRTLLVVVVPTESNKMSVSDATVDKANADFKTTLTKRLSSDVIDDDVSKTASKTASTIGRHRRRFHPNGVETFNLVSTSSNFFCVTDATDK